MPNTTIYLPSNIHHKYQWKSVKIAGLLLGLFLLIFQALQISQAAGCGTKWTWRSPLPQGNTLTSVTWGGNKFVAVGYAGTILTSPDGNTWTVQFSGVNNSGTDSLTMLSSVIWGGNKFVAVGKEFSSVGEHTLVFLNYSVTKVILTSPDGVNWTKQSLGAGYYGLNSVIWADNQFVAVGGDNTILTSPDGITWTEQSSGMDSFFKLKSVTWGDGQFVIVGSDITGSGTILTSIDGVNWSKAPLSEVLSSIVWGNNQFVALGYKSILTSPDGVNWTKQPLTIKGELKSVIWNGSQFIAVGASDGFPNTVLTSPDGVKWTKHLTKMDNTINTLNGISWNGTQFVAVGWNGTILTSLDGINWQLRSSGAALPWISPKAVTWGRNKFVAVGSGTIMTSPDGVKWTVLYRDIELNSVIWGGSQFVAVGSQLVMGTDNYYHDTSAVITSPDGVKWTKQTSGNLGLSLNSVTWGDNQFVAVGDGTIMTSPDGVTWTLQSSEMYNSIMLKSVTWGDGQFVVVGTSGFYGSSSSSSSTILTSPDGVTWTKQSVEQQWDSLSSVTWGDNKFVAVGGYGTILTSQNGINWKPRSYSGVVGGMFTSVTSNGSQFVAVASAGGEGFNDNTPIGGIVTSSNGIKWKWHSLGNILTGVAGNSSKFVVVGDGTILTSSCHP